MTPAHRAMIRTEIAVSTAINACLPTAIIALIGIAPPTTLFDGDAPLIRGLMPATGLATFLMTLIITLLVRARMRKGIVAPLALAVLPAGVRWLPRALPLRALVMAVVAVVVLVPLWCAVVTIVDLLPLTRTGQTLFNLVLGISVGVTMTPWVVLRAFGDRGAA